MGLGAHTRITFAYLTKEPLIAASAGFAIGGLCWVLAKLFRQFPWLVPFCASVICLWLRLLLELSALQDSKAISFVADAFRRCADVLAWALEMSAYDFAQEAFQRVGLPIFSWWKILKMMCMDRDESAQRRLIQTLCPSFREAVFVRPMWHFLPPSCDKLVRIPEFHDVIESLETYGSDDAQDFVVHFQDAMEGPDGEVPGLSDSGAHDSSSEDPDLDDVIGSLEFLDVDFHDATEGDELEKQLDFIDALEDVELSQSEDFHDVVECLGLADAIGCHMMPLGLPGASMHPSAVVTDGGCQCLSKVLGKDDLSGSLESARPSSAASLADSEPEAEENPHPELPSPSCTSAHTDGISCGCAREPQGAVSADTVRRLLSAGIRDDASILLVDDWMRDVLGSPPKRTASASEPPAARHLWLPWS